jgi:hypothetical protein
MLCDPRHAIHAVRCPHRTYNQHLRALLTASTDLLEILAERLPPAPWVEAGDGTPSREEILALVLDLRQRAELRSRRRHPAAKAASGDA